MSICRGSAVWNGKDHDDLCYACGYPGELLECDECPRVYHLICIGMDDVPSGKFSCAWHICDECKTFTFNKENLDVACCCSCTTSYCMSCVPSAVEQRLHDPNVAHMSKRTAVPIKEVRRVSSASTNMIKYDYNTDGGLWCANFLSARSMVFICQPCEKNMIQENGDYLDGAIDTSAFGGDGAPEDESTQVPSHRLLEDKFEQTDIRTVVAGSRLGLVGVMDMTSESEHTNEQKNEKQKERRNGEHDDGSKHVNNSTDDQNVTSKRYEEIYLERKEDLVVYGQYDPDFNYDDLRSSPVECVKVGEAYPFYRWKSEEDASTALGQNMSFISIAAHSFERFRLALDDKVKLAFGLVWRYCDTHEYVSGYPAFDHIDSVREGIRAFWFKRSIQSEKNGDYRNALNSLEQLMAVPGKYSEQIALRHKRLSMSPTNMQMEVKMDKNHATTTKSERWASGRGFAKNVDIRLEPDGPVLRRFKSGISAAEFLRTAQTQISASCCKNAKLISQSQSIPELKRSLGFIFTFQPDTESTSPAGANVEIVNLSQTEILDLSRAKRRVRGRPAFASEPVVEHLGEVESTEINGRVKRMRKRPHESGMIYNTDEAIAYAEHLESLGPISRNEYRYGKMSNDDYMYSSHSDSDEDSLYNDELLMHQERTPSNAAKSETTFFLGNTERRRPVIGRAHQADIPLLINHRSGIAGSDWTSDEEQGLAALETHHRVWASKLDNSAEISNDLVFRLSCAQYIPGLVVHLAKEQSEYGDMSVGVVLESPSLLKRTILLNDGRSTIFEVPLAIVQQVIPYDAILKLCFRFHNNNHDLVRDEAVLTHEVIAHARVIRSRQLDPAQLLQFFDGVENYGSNLQRVYRALRPLPSRSCAVSAQEREMGPLDMSLKRARASSSEISEISSTLCAVVPPYASSSQAARSNDRTRAPEFREIMLLFHLLKNILPCRQYEDEFKNLKTDRIAMSETFAGLSSSGGGNSREDDHPSEVMVFSMKDAHQKMRRAQVHSAFSFADKINKSDPTTML